VALPGPHPHRRPRRCPGVLRARCAGPQRHQDPLPSRTRAPQRLRPGPGPSGPRPPAHPPGHHQERISPPDPRPAWPHRAPTARDGREGVRRSRKGGNQAPAPRHGLSPRRWGCRGGAFGEGRPIRRPATMPRPGGLGHSRPRQVGRIIGQVPAAGVRRPRGRASLVGVGEQLSSAVLQRCELSTYLLQLPGDTRQLGFRLPLPVLAVVVRPSDQVFNLPAQESQPGAPVDRADPVLELAGVDRREDLVLREPELPAALSCRSASRPCAPTPRLRSPRPNSSASRTAGGGDGTRCRLATAASQRRARQPAVAGGASSGYGAVTWWGSGSVRRRSASAREVTLSRKRVAPEEGGPSASNPATMSTVEQRCVSHSSTTGSPR